MAVINRHNDAPFADGETLAGADLEADFNTVYTLVNGALDDTNLASNAVTTAKITDGNVTNAKLADDTVELGKMAAASVGKAQVETATAATTMTSSTTFVDVPDVSAITIDVGSTDDIIEMDLSVTGKTTTWGHWAYGFKVAGTDSDRVGVLGMKFTAVEALGLLTRQSAMMTYATSGFSGSTVIQPRYHLISGGASVGVFADTLQGSMLNRVFRVRVIPIKV